MSMKCTALFATISLSLLGSLLQGIDTPTREDILTHCQTIAHNPSSRNLRAFNAIFKSLDVGTLHALECSQEILEAIQAALGTATQKPLKVDDLPTLHTCLPKLGIQLHHAATLAILSAIATRLESDPKSMPYWNGFSKTVDDCEERMYLSGELANTMKKLKDQIKAHTKAPLTKRMQSLSAFYAAIIAETEEG